MISWIPLSLGMREVIKDTAIVNAEDPYWDDGFYNQYIPHQIQGKCPTRDALKGLQTLFFNIHEAYSTKKNPTPERILQMVYGNGYEEWGILDLQRNTWMLAELSKMHWKLFVDWPRSPLETVCSKRMKEITS